MAENTTYTLTRENSPSGRLVNGKIVLGATALTAADYIEVDVGFKPTYVRFENATSRIMAEHYWGMADESCIKTIANGTRTLEVTGGNKGITLTSRGFRIAQNATLAVVEASTTAYFVAEA